MVRGALPATLPVQSCTSLLLSQAVESKCALIFPLAMYMHARVRVCVGR